MYSYLSDVKIFTTCKLANSHNTCTPAHLVSNDVTATHSVARAGKGSRYKNERWTDSYIQIEANNPFLEFQPQMFIKVIVRIGCTLLFFIRINEPEAQKTFSLLAATLAGQN